MPTLTTYKMKTKGKNLYLRVVKGHFATGRSHTNYFIDVTMQKSRVSEAEAVAKELVQFYNRNTMVDTILCLDEMQVVGAFLAKELTRGDFMNMNAHQTIYVVTPEQTAGNQLIFRDSVAPMIQGKHVLVLAASVNTGYTAKAAADAVRYRETTVQKTLDFYFRMVDELKPKTENSGSISSEKVQFLDWVATCVQNARPGVETPDYAKLWNEIK